MEGGAVANSIAINDEGHAFMLSIGKIVHLVKHQLIQDGSKSTCSGLTLERQLGNLLQGALGELKL